MDDINNIISQTMATLTTQHTTYLHNVRAGTGISGVFGHTKEASLREIESTYESMKSTLIAATSPELSQLETRLNSAGLQLQHINDNPNYLANMISHEDSMAKVNIDTQNAHHQHAIHAINSDPALVTATSTYVADTAHYSDLCQRLDRTKPILSKKFYYVALVLLGVSEFVLNYTAFSTMGGTIMETALSAVSAGIFFPIAAHYLSKFLRQEPHKFTTKIYVPVIIIAVIGLAVFLARQIVQSGIANQLIESKEAANGMFFLRLFLVLGIFLAGFLLSYFNLEPNVNFLNAYNKLQDSKAIFDQQQNIAFERTRAADTENVGRISDIETNRLRKIMEIHNLPTKLTNEVAELGAAIHSVKITIDHNKALIQAWCDNTKSYVN